MDKFFNFKDFDVDPKYPSTESLRRWRSACTVVKNPKRRFRMVADLDRRSEDEKKKRQMQEKIRLALCIRETALQLIEVLSLLSLEDVSSSEYTMTEAAEAGRFQDLFDDVGSISDDDAEISLIMELVYNFSLNEKYRRRIISWQKGDLLGRGSFGSVYRGFTDDGFFFAVKEVSLQDQGTQGEQSVLQLEQEISLLSRFEHDNIVQYFGTEKDENKLYIFLELVTQGSLAKNYQEYHLKDSQVSAYTWQILNGLKYLHEQNVIHRDIKCANILVEANGSVKLADFGLAKVITMNDVKSCRGSPFWMAPEVVNLKNDGYGLTADIWSLGCTVLEMLTRCPPYYPLEGMQALFKIGRGELPPIPDSVSRDARGFILKCLQVNPNDRPTAAQLMEHPFVKRPMQALFKIGRGELPPIPDSVSRDARGFILKCLQVSPNDQPTAAELMEHPFVKRLHVLRVLEVQDCDALNEPQFTEWSIQVPLDVITQLLPIDSRSNLEGFTMDPATLLLILICFEVNLATCPHGYCVIWFYFLLE